MFAVDTNVVIRYLTSDHPLQSPIARTLVDSNPVLVTKTVMLECEWVMRSGYGYDRKQICQQLRAFAGLPTVTVEDPIAVDEALALHEAGLDFADALHLQSSIDCEAMVTFDRDFAKRAKRAGLTDVRKL
jgi:predicted nucleic-acid-binding protein